MLRLLLPALLLLAPPQDKVEALVVDLFGKDTRARFSAYLALQKTRPAEAMPMLLRGVHSAPLRGQDYALTVIERYALGVKRKAMRSLLASKSPFVAFSAGVSLYRLGDKGHLKVVLSNFEEGKSKTAVLRQMVARTTYIGIPELNERISALVDEELDETTLDQILYSLARQMYRPAMRNVAELIKLESVKSDRVMICLAFALAVGDAGSGLAGLAGHEKRLIAELDDASAVTLTRIQKFLRMAPELSDELLSAIGANLKSVKSGHQLASWIGLLAEHGKPSLAKWIQPMVEHKEAVAAKAAVKALVGLHKIDVAALRRLLNSRRKELVLVAAETLRRMDDPSGLPSVLEVARSKHSKVETVSVLAGFRSKQVVPVLIDFLEDSNQTVRSRASSGLTANLRALYPFRKFNLVAAGYQASGSASSRKDAVVKIRAWWSANQ